MSTVHCLLYFVQCLQLKSSRRCKSSACKRPKRWIYNDDALLLLLQCYVCRFFSHNIFRCEWKNCRVPTGYIFIVERRFLVLMMLLIQLLGQAYTTVLGWENKVKQRLLTDTKKMPPWQWNKNAVRINIFSLGLFYFF